MERLREAFLSPIKQNPVCQAVVVFAEGSLSPKESRNMFIELQDYSRLIKISKNPNALRTESMLGFARVPRFGDRLIIYGRGLINPERVRLIVTSMVQKIVKSGPSSYLIQTENSTYRLERIGPCAAAIDLFTLMERAEENHEGDAQAETPESHSHKSGWPMHEYKEEFDE